jgi:glutamate/tyrosine decarboxylase-like PLP-dependent enzyme
VGTHFSYVTLYRDPRPCTTFPSVFFAPIHGVTCVFDAPDYDEDALRAVQQRLLVRGEAILGRTVIKGRPALKCTFMNPLTTTLDVDHVLALIARELPFTVA